MLETIASHIGQSAGLIGLILLALWLLSLKLKDASIIDIFWGAGFTIIGAICLWLSDAATPYIILLCALPMIWGVRLSLYLARRNLGHGEDYRYVAMRKRKIAQNWPLYSLVFVFLLQGVIMLIVSAPLWIASATTSYSSPVTQIGVLSLIGAIVWFIGFLFETIGDMQLSAFIKTHKDYDGPYENKLVLDTGLWKYTRHPNYFGNACMWWGTWLIACQAPLGWISFFGPALMTFFLMRVSGKDLLERKLKKRPAYTEYITRTSGFFPRRPKS